MKFQNALAWLYANWAYTNILIGFFVSILLFSSYHSLPYYIFLVWLQFPIYLMHQCEEHGIPGGFQQFVNDHVFNEQRVAEPFNPKRIFWINATVIWLLFPLFAVLAQHINPAFGLFLPVFGIINATTHVVVALAKRLYNPGLGISLFLNYPLGIYTLMIAHKCGSLTWGWSFCMILFSLGIHAAMIGCARYWYVEYRKKSV